MHSITGTITGLIDFGMLMGDDSIIIERARDWCMMSDMRRVSQQLWLGEGVPLDARPG